ncbi:MAG TPA: ABC transporter permease [Candidatus Acidoferrum sp.]
MVWTRRFSLKLQSLFRRDRSTQRLNDEIQFHLDQQIAENLASGMNPHEARHLAMRAFGNPTFLKEETRDTWGWTWLEQSTQDLRYAARTLRKSPGFTLVAVLTLALGIGANTAIFTVVNAALLRPLPFSDPDRLVQVFHRAPRNVSGGGIFGVATGNFVEWHAQQHVFDGLAVYHFHGLNLTAGDKPEAIPGAEVSEDFFHVLDVQPLLGRTFSSAEMQPGNERAVVLSYAVWQDDFGSDPGIVGRTISFDRQGYTVIGLMPKSFRFPSWAKLWVPAAWTADERANRNNHNSTAIGRLKPGFTLSTAQAEMDAISHRLAAIYPKEDAGWGAVVLPLRDNEMSDVRTPLLVLLGAVAFVLLIACCNVASLVLAKTLSRRKEIAIRAALGASRSRVLQMVLTETIMLSLGGGALGLLLDYYGIPLILAFLGNRLPGFIDVGPDRTVLLFALGTSIVSGIFAGLLPALRFTRSRADLHESLKEGLGRTDSDSGHVRSRNALVTVEVALCMMLLVGAGLLVRTLWVLQATDPGFNPQNVLTVVLPRPNHADHTFLAQVLERLRGLPGVEAAGATSNIPLSGSNESTWSIQLEGEVPKPIAQQPDVPTDIVTPGYFAALRIPLLRGRDFTNADRADRPRVIIISQAMAARFWPHQDALGKRLFVSWTEPDKPREVIGIVGNTKERGLMQLHPLAQMYVPDAQSPFAADSIMLRTSQPPKALLAAATSTIHELDRQQPVVGVDTMEGVIAESYADNRSNMQLLVSFAALALVLAAVGIYGVLSYSVRRRLREIGIRLALGATSGDVLRLVVLEGMRPAAIGLAIGIAGALAFARVVSTMIFGVRPTDAATYASVAALLATVSLLACIFPAWRATRVQPLKVLRDE